MLLALSADYGISVVVCRHYDVVASSEPGWSLQPDRQVDRLAAPQRKPRADDALLPIRPSVSDCNTQIGASLRNNKMSKQQGYERRSF